MFGIFLTGKTALQAVFFWHVTWSSLVGQ
jgi:hypothetical protein